MLASKATQFAVDLKFIRPSQLIRFNSHPIEAVLVSLSGVEAPLTEVEVITDLALEPEENGAKFFSGQIKGNKKKLNYRFGYLTRDTFSNGQNDSLSSSRN